MIKTVLTYQAKVFVYEDKKKNRLDGFWLLVTNHSEKGGNGFIKDINSIESPCRDKVLIALILRY